MATAAVFLMAALSVVGAVQRYTIQDFLQEVVLHTGGVLTTGTSTRSVYSLTEKGSTPGCYSGEVKCFNCTHILDCREPDWEILPCFRNSFCDRRNPGCNVITSTCDSHDREAEVDENFTCTSNGIFPILGGDCTEFRVCVKSQAYKLNCVKGETFNTEVMTCVAGYPSCADPCLGLKFGKVHLVKELYVKCIRGKAELIFNCKKYHELNNNPCGPKCTHEGNFPIRGECRKFVSCLQDVNGIERKEMYCPEGTWFNPTKKKCQNVNLTNPPPPQCT